MKAVYKLKVAAIKFHIDKTDETVVLCGCRHGDIFGQLKRLGFHPKEGYQEIAQGFITNKGEFLNRHEAFYHAKECGQLPDNLKIYDYRLFSEDLW